MKTSTAGILDALTAERSELAGCRPDMEAAFNGMAESFRKGGKLLICGNGGSAADAEHMVGELMKGFKLKRPIAEPEKVELARRFGGDGQYLAGRLQRALPAVSLAGHCALSTAFANDVAADLVFAQQVYGLGKPGDMLLCLSTSGNSLSVVYAAMAAKFMGLGSVAMTGQSAGKLGGLCDISIRVPETETYRVQELHLPVYHALCAMLENEFFGEAV